MSACRTTAGKPKVRYDTRAAAKAAARWMLDNIDDADPTAMKAYRCPTCGFFHLGHYPTDPERRAHLRSRHRTP